MKLVISLLLLCLCSGASAQNVEKKNPWVLSTEMSMSSLSFNQGYNNTGREKLDAQYNQFKIGTGYRVNRWFELTGSLLNRRNYYYENKILSNNLNSDKEYPFNIQTNTYLLGLIVGGRLLLRINQGNLFISGSYGLNLQWQSIAGSDFQGQEFQYSYKAQSYTMSSLEIGYTFWVTRKVALSFALEATLYTADSLFETKALRKDNSGLSNLTKEEKNFLKGDLPTGLSFFNIGISYRL